MGNFAVVWMWRKEHRIKIFWEQIWRMSMIFQKVNTNREQPESSYTAQLTSLPHIEARCFYFRFPSFSGIVKYWAQNSTLSTIRLFLASSCVINWPERVKHRMHACLGIDSQRISEKSLASCKSKLQMVQMGTCFNFLQVMKESIFSHPVTLIHFGP